MLVKLHKIASRLLEHMGVISRALINSSEAMGPLLLHALLTWLFQ